ncbi:Cytokinin riboside 5'-monophosphate phosphoribohydrolase LOG3 [Capsicum chinense]|nr:Cytokinin riboside 5'-monophosphate phosphoribohydrolase LOG3 [Capsicum chinense]
MRMESDVMVLKFKRICVFCGSSQGKKSSYHDAAIELDGYDTLGELLEVISWAQLSIHDKSIGLLNVDGYYNSLSSFIDKVVEEDFISSNARQIILSATITIELVEKLEEYVPCH